MEVQPILTHGVPKWQQGLGARWRLSVMSNKHLHPSDISEKKSYLTYQQVWEGQLQHAVDSWPQQHHGESGSVTLRERSSWASLPLEKAPAVLSLIPKYDLVLRKMKECLLFVCLFRVKQTFLETLPCSTDPPLLRSGYPVLFIRTVVGMTSGRQRSVPAN